jgi:hypothetical protein
MGMLSTKRHTSVANEQHLRRCQDSQEAAARIHFDFAMAADLDAAGKAMKMGTAVTVGGVEV